jgi:endogenous inhibitor of DNA gyrase (YacG/DUF329 family)
MKCPICLKPTLEEMRPFCSKRCADVDLARWFNGSYAVPSSEPVDPEDIEQALEEAIRKPDAQGGVH